MTLSPGAGFEQPFEMLHVCHERMHRMLGLLARLREYLPAHGADEQARQASRDVMRYFDQAGPQHHLDEELHVFPALLAQGEPAMVAVVKRLQQDHEQMKTRWADARRVLAAIAAGELDLLVPDEISALDAFAGLYGSHIEAEEQIAYPAAALLLEGARLEAMSRDMMIRRGLR